MADKEINLILEQFAETEKEKKLKKILNILTPLVILVFSVAVVSIYSFSLLQSARLSDVNKKINNTKTQIQEMSETESYLRGTKIKLEAVKKILNQQVDYAEVVGQLQEVTPPELNFTNLLISGDKSVEVSFRAANSDLTASLLNNLLDFEIGGKYFDKVKLKSLSYSREGNYLFTLQFRIR